MVHFSLSDVSLIELSLLKINLAFVKGEEQINSTHVSCIFRVNTAYLWLAGR